MGIKSFGNNAEDFVNKFVKARGGDSTGLDAVTPNIPPPPPEGLEATGGVISDYSVGNTVYRAHIFTSSGTFNVTAPGGYGDTVEALVVGGGGGGGSHSGGGGGAGGLLLYGSPTGGKTANGSALPVSDSPGVYTITIGNGGSGASATYPSPSGDDGFDGGNTIFNGPTFSAVTATGGGGGGGETHNSNLGRPGGSGGGSSRNASACLLYTSPSPRD